MSNQDQIINTIATKILFIETLETRKRDELDFNDLAVWDIKRALEAAYLAGQASASKKAPAKLTFMQHQVLSTAIAERDGKLAWFPKPEQHDTLVRGLAKHGYIHECNSSWWVSATGHQAVEDYAAV